MSSTPQRKGICAAKRANLLVSVNLQILSLSSERSTRFIKKSCEGFANHVSMNRSRLLGNDCLPKTNASCDFTVSTLLSQHLVQGTTEDEKSITAAARVQIMAEKARQECPKECEMQANENCNEPKPLQPKNRKQFCWECQNVVFVNT